MSLNTSAEDGTAPPDRPAIDTFALKATAYDLVLSLMAHRKNDLSHAHKAALMQAADVLSRVAAGELQGRYVIDLPTGAGKTTSIVAWLTAIHRLGLDLAVTVAASQVEALASIIEDVTALGVPADMIGLKHGKKYDQVKAEALRKARQASEPPAEDLKDYASLPPTEANDTRQFLFVSHQRVRVATDSPAREDLLTTFGGRKRELLIWDEVMLSADASTIALANLQSGVAALKPLVTDSDTAAVLALEHFGKVVAMLEAEGQAQSAGAQPRPLEFPTIGTLDRDHFRRIVGERLGNDSPQAVALRALLDGAGQQWRLARTGKRHTLIRYRPTIPEGLTNIAILDAGHRVNRLVALDSTVQYAPGFDRLAETYGPVTSYENVTINYANGRSGRSAMEAALGAHRGDTHGQVDAIVDAISKVPPDEAVLVFTFKEHRGKTDLPTALTTALRKAGVDPDSRLPPTSEHPEGRPRIVILTWGQHTSLNTYGYAKHVVFAGILQREDGDLLASSVGQAGDLLADVDHERFDLTPIKRGEVAGLIYQALSRGTCRFTSGGKAGAMTVWLIHHDAQVREDLERLMPGVVWQEWNIGNDAVQTKAETIALQIAAYLRDFEGDSIGNRTIKRHLALRDVAHTTFNRATNMVDAPGWIRRQSSFAREGTLAGLGFDGEEEDGVSRAR